MPARCCLISFLDSNPGYRSASSIELQIRSQSSSRFGQVRVMDKWPAALQYQSFYCVEGRSFCLSHANENYKTPMVFDHGYRTVDRKRTLQQIDEFLNTKVAPKEFADEIKGKLLVQFDELFKKVWEKDVYEIREADGTKASMQYYHVLVVDSLGQNSLWVETKILGEVQDLPKGLEREKRIQTIMRQLLFTLDSLHSTGIVHRDINPQNIIFSEAADLRVGINYIPKEFLLDPRYSAPEQYIMSTQTPSAPSAPVATALSPVLWQMNLPDRFDMYSMGLISLQMVLHEPMLL
ncbi:hypothetical protein KSP40_PGU008842 [Platanthera guangdongensis]|uniref:Protein kinase domain-containing protein n=1 Tax=Platanthera guangdongensis TaxID=2320717 RepID=A0ABR2LD81_9ASPA